MAAHATVLAKEAAAALAIKPGGAYVDGTYGRGGHARAILAELGADGRLLVVDRDPLAIAHARSSFADDPRVTVCHAGFDELLALLGAHGVPFIDGLLLDLGVSSPQLDDGQRGFSFTHDGPLDMRMNIAAGQTAAQWLAGAPEREIADVIFRYGEERNSRRIARAIVARRSSAPLETTVELAELVRSQSRHYDRNKHPATRTFQALRIHVNDELGALERVLDAVMGVLAEGGRLVVISFHSLEDRIVKRFIRNEVRGADLPRRLPVRDAEINRRLRAVGKAVRPGVAETRDNRRARSAVMRVAERLA